ncbi:MAG: UDP-N-acetylmuramoyl-L-alanine--D-glutamate ligase [Acidobacteria bacterium]|nr:UDP-N-acetylmuramoyl-L-alanine--D-glutamate ligase [Acidobacteriota bacterium]
MLINTEQIKKTRYVIVGAARSGLSAAEFLAAHGAKVTVSDKKTVDQLNGNVEKMKQLDVDLDLGGHTEKKFLKADCIVLSPGVPKEIAQVVKAREAGIEVISEVELAFRHTDAQVIGITGSNGKTTTTSLTGAIFKEAGYNSLTCGNIGNSFIGELKRHPETEYFVVELSSFQLETIKRFKPSIASILNITPDHLDRYFNFNEYADAKAQIFMNQTGDESAILNHDDIYLKKLAPNLKSKILWFSSHEPVANGCCLKDGKICLMEDGKLVYEFDPSMLIIKGPHNIENFMASCLMARAAGIDVDSIKRAASAFKPIEHRLEFVRKVLGVMYYNDSKATNIDSTIKALESFEKNIILILGGKDKGGDFTTLESYLKTRVKKVILTGEAGDKIREQIGGMVDFVQERKFEYAVNAAIGVALPGDIVLLAPACASFDEFENYEERGRKFKEIIGSMTGGDSLDG